MENEEIKLSLFEGDLMVYIQIPKDLQNPKHKIKQKHR